MTVKASTIIFSIFLLFKLSYSAQKKHVVLIVADDLGWNDVSFHGSSQFQTPNIDILAYSGIILHNYYVFSICTPSRSALMTGIHPIHTGMHTGVIHDGEPYGLPLEFKILPQYLKELGYTTRAVGKWHLGFYRRAYTPLCRGFDSHFGNWGSKEDYFTHKTLESSFKIGLDLRRNWNATWDYNGQYMTDILTEESVDIINSHNTSEPLFLYLAHLATHVGNSKNPLQAPPEIIEMFSYIKDKNRRIFAAMAWKLDESVGKVVQALASKNMLNDTIIIFTSDNGGSAGGIGAHQGSNWPLRGTKSSFWEGGVRGASFVWSADLPHSKVSNALMHIQDWLPTILGAVDQTTNGNSTILEGIDGHNMWPVLKGSKDSEYDELILQRNYENGFGALRKNNWKILQNMKDKTSHNIWHGANGRDDGYDYNVTNIHLSTAAAALSQSNCTLPSYEEIILLRTNVSLSCDYCGENGTTCTECDASKDEVCLFDLSNDPCEKNNLASEYPNVLSTLLETMSHYVPVPPQKKLSDPRANPKFWNNTWTNWMDYIDEMI